MCQEHFHTSNPIFLMGTTSSLTMKDLRDSNGIDKQLQMPLFLERHNRVILERAVLTKIFDKDAKQI